MKNQNSCCAVILFVFFCAVSLYSVPLDEVDWSKGKIYSFIEFDTDLDYFYSEKNIVLLNRAKEQAKINFYRVLKNIETADNGQNLYEYIDQLGEKKSRLFTLLDQSRMEKLQYLPQGKMRVVYSINLYGKENSIMSIVMEKNSYYASELAVPINYNYENHYTGIIIDARGVLKSFEEVDVKISPSLFLTVRDTDGKEVFNRHNVLPEVILERGMVRYSYDIHENATSRVGENPLRIVAYGAGSRSGAVVVISREAARDILSSRSTRDAVRNGRIEVVIDR